MYLLFTFLKLLDVQGKVILLPPFYFPLVVEPIGVPFMIANNLEIIGGSNYKKRREMGYSSSIC